MRKEFGEKNIFLSTWKILVSFIIKETQIQIMRQFVIYQVGDSHQIWKFTVADGKGTGMYVVQEW